MKSFYNIIDKIKTVVNAEPFNSTVTFGDISDIDLKKQSIFPLAHIMVNNATINDNYITFNVTLFVMDLVEVSKEADTSLFLGNDNTQDVLNTQLQVVNLLQQEMRRGDTFSENFQITTSVIANPIIDSYENELAGWGVTIDIEVPTNELSLC